MDLVDLVVDEAAEYEGVEDFEPDVLRDGMTKGEGLGLGLAEGMGGVGWGA